HPCPDSYLGATLNCSSFQHSSKLEGQGWSKDRTLGNALEAIRLLRCGLGLRSLRSSAHFRVSPRYHVPSPQLI
ncbi:hypothetical protein GIB67_007570, partial [Kingdonia uniflora]